MQHVIKYHCFVSYTTREEEVRLIKPKVDELIDAIRAHGLEVANVPIFYDHLSFRGQRFDPAQLQQELLEAIESSVCMVAFISPGYISSTWCMYEFGLMDAIQRLRRLNTSAVLPLLWKYTDQSSFYQGRHHIDLLDQFHGGHVHFEEYRWHQHVKEVVEFIRWRTKELASHHRVGIPVVPSANLAWWPRDGEQLR